MSTEDTNIIYGRHPVTQCFKRQHDKIEHMWLQSTLTEHDRFRRMISEARKSGIVVSLVNRKTLDRLTQGGVHQGVAVRLSAIKLWEFSPWLDQLPDGNRPAVVLALDQIRDPGNMGNIFRTASAAAVDGILIPKHESAPFSPAAVKASSGTLDMVPAARVVNLSRSIETLKTKGFWAVGISPEGSGTIQESPFPERVIIVVGSEGSGIRPSVTKICDDVRSIPLTGEAGSINVASAVAVVLYEIIRGR
jgi:23S rRNA (guanosine2251-2'-O)-methyltransferase